MQFLLFTTSDAQSNRRSDLARLIASVGANLASCAGASVHHVLLMQRCSEAERQALAATIPYPSTVLASEQRLSLSAARNAMLAHANESGLIVGDAIVAFPDDDCWYTDGLIARLAETFRTDQLLGLLIARVSLSPKAGWQRSDERTATTADVLRLSCSNAIFVRGSVARELGEFDRTLGVGTPNGSGEDTDYAIRASFAAPRTIVVNRAIVGHHEADLSVISKYFGGTMVVISRYALRSPSFFYEFARKLAVGGCLVVIHRLKPAAYLTAVRNGIGAFGEGRKRA